MPRSYRAGFRPATVQLKSCAGYDYIDQVFCFVNSELLLMPLKYHPKAGEILICKYPKDMEAPEMIKTRPVVCISPKLKHRDRLVTVVPLSSTKPRYLMPYHYEINLPNPLPEPWNNNPFWAIGDHPMTVGFQRLELIRLGKDQYGKRKYYQHKLDKDDVEGIRKALASALGI